MSDAINTHLNAYYGAFKPNGKSKACDAIFSPVTATFKIIGRWVVIFSILTSGFVLSEPAPYELILVGLIAIWFISGLKISQTCVVLFTLLILYNIGGLFSMLTMERFGDAPLYLAVSMFLALTSVFFAALIEDDHRILPSLFNAYVIAALVTAMLGILGYFGLIPGSESFTRYERAKGAFEDPNVFGPFLILPALYLMHRIINGFGPMHRRCSIYRELFLLALNLLGAFVLSFAIFLSFSRAAWGIYLISSLLLIILMLTRHRTFRFRIKMVRFGLMALVLLALALVIILQIEQVTDLLANRAQLVQSYDIAHNGRFSRHAIGFAMALEHPFGIGPLEFGKMFGEDPHNIFLKSLMAYGWLGLISYLFVLAATFCFGFTYMLRARPWQIFFMLTMIVMFAHAIIGFVIDTDHWRHFYFLLGVAWGCIALERKYGARFG